VVDVQGSETEVVMILFGDSDGTWVAVAMSTVAAAATIATLLVNKTSERRAKRDEMEYAAERVSLKSSINELKNDRDECMKQHAEKDQRINHLETRLDECHKDHEASNRDREKLWEAIRSMQAGPV
jgi:peptidoglycan hydrolase CwlO-like protein